MSMTKEEAVIALEEVHAEYNRLWDAREADGTDCFWCDSCGGGTAWKKEIDGKRDEIFALFPELDDEPQEESEPGESDEDRRYREMDEADQWRTGRFYTGL